MNAVLRTLLTVYLVLTTLASIVFGYLYFKNKPGDAFELTMDAIEESVVDLRDALDKSLMQGETSSQGASKDVIVADAMTNTKSMEDYFADIDYANFATNESEGTVKKNIYATFEQMTTMILYSVALYTNDYDEVYKASMSADVPETSPVQTDKREIFWRVRKINPTMCLFEIYRQDITEVSGTPERTTTTFISFQIDFSRYNDDVVKYDAIYANESQYNDGYQDVQQAQCVSFTCEVNAKNEVLELGFMQTLYEGLTLNQFKQQYLQVADADSPTMGVYADMRINKIKEINSIKNASSKDKVIDYVNDVKSLITDYSFLKDAQNIQDVTGFWARFQELVDEFSEKFYV